MQCKIQNNKLEKNNDNPSDLKGGGINLSHISIVTRKVVRVSAREEGHIRGDVWFGSVLPCA